MQNNRPIGDAFVESAVAWIKPRIPSLYDRYGMMRPIYHIPFVATIAGLCTIGTVSIMRHVIGG